MGTCAAADKLASVTGGNGLRSSNLRSGCSEPGRRFLGPPSVLSLLDPTDPPEPVPLPALAALRASLGAGSQEEAEPEQPGRTDP